MTKVLDSPEQARSASDKQRSLERFVIVFSLLSLVGINLLVGFGLHFIYRGHLIENTEKNAINAGGLIFEREKRLLLDPSENTLTLTQKENPEFDRRIRLYLKHLDILKIKFFNRGQQVVYSTDFSIVGKIDDDNMSLERALDGHIVSNIVKKGSVLDLAGETRFNVDVVETYFPVRNSRNEVVGAFETYSDVSIFYAEARMVWFRSITVLAAVLVVVFGMLLIVVRRLTKRLVSAQRELERLAITDELTKLYNRGFLIKRAEEELSKMRRISKKWGLASATGFILFDVDDFKEINDRFGHIAGDAVLQEIAERVRQCLRTYDLVGRFGGEEFLIILPNTPTEETRAIAERIWKRFRETPFPAAGMERRITASFGIACINGRDCTVQEVLQKADERLYKAKREGKDRVVWS